MTEEIKKQLEGLKAEFGEFVVEREGKVIASEEGVWNAVLSALTAVREEALREAIEIVEKGFKTLHGGGNGRRLLVQVFSALYDNMNYNPEKAKCDKCGAKIVPDKEAKIFGTEKWDGHSYKFDCECRPDVRMSVG